MIRTFIKWQLLLSLVLLVAALWNQHALPPAARLDAVLLNEPLQTPTHQAPFETRVDDITYQIKPLYDYELTGLVVSKHDANTWWDYIHNEWNDHLNITDLCVVWGNNVRNGSYQQVSFSSQQFSCNFSTDSQEAFEAFDQTAISNNHLLSDNPRIAKALRKVQIGDQIRVSGYLSEYSHNHGFAFHRGTSTVRTDSGNGACETVFVEGFSIIKSGGGPWRKLVWLAAAMLVAGVIAWFAQPVRFIDTT